MAQNTRQHAQKVSKKRSKSYKKIEKKNILKKFEHQKNFFRREFWKLKMVHNVVLGPCPTIYKEIGHFGRLSFFILDSVFWAHEKIVFWPQLFSGQHFLNNMDIFLQGNVKFPIDWDYSHPILMAGSKVVLRLLHFQLMFSKGGSRVVGGPCPQLHNFSTVDPQTT